ncbi:MAG: hypothetical protein HYZ81_07575, partial [Nitrospinae bacterium]|nr:hypothetical protein [Nitrospinota bacterium]
MHITDIRTVAVRVPIERPTAISTRQLGAREYVLVWIDTDAGHTGIGYTYAGTVGGQVVYALVQAALRPLLLGQDPRLIERHCGSRAQLHHGRIFRVGARHLQFRAPRD